MFEPVGSYVCCLVPKKVVTDSGLVIPNKTPNILEVIGTGPDVKASIIAKRVLIDNNAHKHFFFEDDDEYIIIDERYILGIVHG